MDDTPVNDTLYDPSLDFPLDVAFASPQGVDGADTGAVDTGGSGGPIGGSPSSLLNRVAGILGQTSGAKFLAILIPALIPIIGPLSDDIEHAASHNPIKFLVDMAQHITKATFFNQLPTGRLFLLMRDIAFDKMFRSMLEDGLGVDTAQFTPDEQDAVHTVDTMLGFSASLMFLVTAIDGAGKALLGNRWPESIHETLGKIPEEMGVSWALGITIDESFKAAQGVILEEAINKQKRPNRIQWPQLRTLFKQHVIKDEKTLDDLLAAQGFPDEQIEWLKLLKDSPLPVGDISQLWYRGIISDGTAKELISELGFDANATDHLFDLYMAKADNEASVTYRTILTQLFTNHLISENQYRDGLTAANFPVKLIDQTVAAIKLEQDTGKLLHSMTAIKSRYQHGAINDDEAKNELRQLNYSTTAIGELLESWQEVPIRRRHGLSQAKILTYYVSGILKRDAAYTQLAALGLTDDAINLLLDHPTANPRAHVVRLTPGNVTQAFIDGAIALSELAAAYEMVGVPKENTQYYVTEAVYRAANKKHGPHADLPLTEAHIKDAFKVGLIDFPHMVNMLEHIGYNPDNALLIAETVNKGPNTPPPAPVFNSVMDAVFWMLEHGYIVYPPPDPMLLAAEAILSQAGYTWQQQPNSPPPVPVEPSPQL